jgi:hypothetical protein
MGDSDSFCVECGAKQARTLDQTTLKSTECGIAVSNGALGNTETVYLQTLDGFEFEDFCSRVFEKLLAATNNTDGPPGLQAIQQLGPLERFLPLMQNE